VEIDERLHRCPTDFLLLKKGASCFFGTNLVPLLLSADVDTLVLTGCSTSGCVRATAVDACQYGFRPMVVRQAVGDRSESAHEQSLFDLHSRYADVVGVDEVITHLAKPSSQR
jgi:nicotinamidase-related amidase